jgi:hypothetical protein
MNKKGFEFSFTWIFAIVAGVFILFLAIYGVTKFMDISKSSQGAESATTIGVLTNPLESSFDTAKRVLIKTSVQTRIYTDCNNFSGSFGKQIIGISEETYNKWSNKESHSFPNKYIFSDNPVEGKNFYLFSKPFELPFKVADLIYITSTNDKYCFKNTPADIKGEIDDISGNNLSANENFFTKLSDCPEGSINICFNGGNNCNISVNPTLNYVEKNGKRMYYNGDALMFAAIFSNKNDYECQLDRLMKRTEELSKIYRDKSTLIFQKTGCASGLDSQLIQLENIAGNFENSESIEGVFNIAESVSLANENNYGGCRLW